MQWFTIILHLWFIWKNISNKVYNNLYARAEIRVAFDPIIITISFFYWILSRFFLLLLLFFSSRFSIYTYNCNNMCSGQPVCAWEWLVSSSRYLYMIWRDTRVHATNICLRSRRQFIVFFSVSIFYIYFLFFFYFVSRFCLRCRFYLSDDFFFYPDLCRSIYFLTTVTWKILPYLYVRIYCTYIYICV